MKVKVSDLIFLAPEAPPSIYPALSKVLNATYRTGDVPIGKLTYQLNKIAEGVNAAWESFEKARRAIIDAMDAEDADWRLNEDRIATFNSEFVALLNTEVELYGQPLPLAAIDQARELELSRVDILALAWLFEQEIGGAA